MPASKAKAFDWIKSFEDDQLAKSTELSVADSCDHHQVLGSAERTETFAMRDDALSDNFTNVGQRFQFSRRGCVNVDSFIGFNPGVV